MRQKDFKEIVEVLKTNDELKTEIQVRLDPDENSFEKEIEKDFVGSCEKFDFVINAQIYFRQNYVVEYGDAIPGRSNLYIELDLYINNSLKKEYLTELQYYRLVKLLEDYICII